MKILLIDPSQRNFAMVTAEYANGKINPISWEIVDTGKKSLLESGQEIYKALKRNVRGCAFVVSELPQGSLSSAAAGALALCIGILACIDKPLYTYSPKQVKSVVTPGASKAAMVQWASKRWPSFSWHYSPRGTITVARNEHLADALAAGEYHVRN